MKPRGIFVGLSTIDIIYNVSEQPRANQKITAKSQEIIVGGPATNAAITFSYLCGSATLVSPVGQHSLSSCIREECRQFGIGLMDLTPQAHEPPAISSVTVNAKGQRSVVSANTIGREIPAASVEGASLVDVQVVQVDGHAMHACQAWAQMARETGVRVVFDGGSWKPGTERLLENVDVAICSADFLPPSCAKPEQVSEYLRAAGVKHIAITNGARPIQVVSESFCGELEVSHVEALDTTGAGDILHGAFCFYSAGGYDFKEALGRAAAIATDSCRFRGTREWMRNRI